jgi:hypothetical protein
MFTVLIWWVGVFLEALILLRGWRGRTLAKYPFFYLYIASLFLSDGPLYFVYRLNPAIYPQWNWTAGFLNIVLGCGILLEVFRHVLAPYPGAEKLARTAGLVVFGVVFCSATIYLFVFPGTFGSRMVHTHLERNFLGIQALFLCGLVGVIRYYGIPMGKNLRGMVLGYGLCVGTTLMSLAIRYHSRSFTDAWILIQPASYLLSIFIWVAALWRYEPNLVTDSTVQLRPDYDAFVSSTRNAMGAMRSSLSKVGRP